MAFEEVGSVAGYYPRVLAAHWPESPCQDTDAYQHTIYSESLPCRRVTDAPDVAWRS